MKIGQATTTSPKRDIDLDTTVYKCLNRSIYLQFTVKSSPQEANEIAVIIKMLW